MTSLNEQEQQGGHTPGPTQPPLLPSADCGVESGWDVDFGRTHYCTLEVGHEGDHFMIQKPGYLRHRVFGHEPLPPRARRMSWT